VERAQIDLVRTTFKPLSGQAELLAARFLARLFEQHPELRAIFPEDLSGHLTRLPAAMRRVVRRIDRFARIEPALLVLGAKSARAGVRPEHYSFFRGAFLGVIGDACGASWTEPTQAAWKQGVDAVAGVMIRGAFAAKARRAWRRAA
jgi:hemoglobin-like flavoprotein